jgi:3-dehydroquinate synthase
MVEMRADSSFSPDPNDSASPRNAEASQEPYLQRFSVSFEYPVHFTVNALAPDNPVVAEAVRRTDPMRRHRVLVVVDKGVAAVTPNLESAVRAYGEAHAATLELTGAPEIVPGGEAAKVTSAVVDRVLARIHDDRIDRKSCVLVIGGGAVQDAAGYAASIAHRGVRVVRMPTTVESQCDSGVGVKNAINAFDTKNFVGSFAPPFAVVNDRDFLVTLSPRDVRAGMAEAVKVALLKDPAFFDWLWRKAETLAAGEMRAVEQLVRRTAELHLEHIAGCGDPFERAASKPLDYGHWAAHKLEALSSFELRHGEAVAIGLAIDGRFAVERGLLSEEVVARVCVLLERLGFTLWHSSLALRASDGRRAVMDGLEEFREHLGGALILTLLSDIGRPVDVDSVDTAVMERAIAWLEFRGRAR